MKENEKKVTELNEEELGEIAGGFITPEVRYGDDALICLTCPECGKTYSATLKEFHNFDALCPKCGTFGRRMN